MDSLQIFVAKSLKSWSKDCETTVSKKILNLRVKPYRKWGERLKKQLLMPKNSSVPTTYQELLQQINKTSKYCQNLFYVVINNGREMVVVAVIVTCLDVNDPRAPNEVVPFFVEIGNKSSNHEIKSFGKAVTKSFLKPVEKTPFTLSKTIEYHCFVFNKKYN